MIITSPINWDFWITFFYKLLDFFKKIVKINKACEASFLL